VYTQPCARNIWVSLLISILHGLSEAGDAEINVAFVENTAAIVMQTP
jgi:hypothetical protein